jgi:tRNA 5-methylaminomethyl-2-thiouridine biosynthesis bifunctional protein
MGLYLFTGLGARGLTTAPLLAAHLASNLFDHPSPLPVDLFKAVAPIRFKIKQMKQNKGL